MPRTRLRPDEDIRFEETTPRQQTGQRWSGWTWFWAAFSVVLLVGVSILYLASRPEEEVAPVTVAPEPDDDAPPADEAPPADDPVAVPASQTSGVLLGTYVVDSFGFHAMEEAYADATEVGERDAGNISKVIAAIDAVEWPDDLTDPVATLRTDLTGLVAALEAGDLEASREGFAAVHSSQHDFSNAVYGWLPTAPGDGAASAVLLGTYVVDSFGFHAMEEAYADATEVGERDAGNISKVIAAIDAVEWPDDLTDPVATLRTDLTGLVAALEAGDLEASREGFAAVHSSQHDFSNAVYSWLPSTPVVADEPGVSAAAVIEIEMVEFGYVPETIEIEAGVPTILRFTNSGKLQHEAMVGDAHMQEEFAAAGGDGGHDPTDGHHGDLMAIVLNPGETGDLEVVIDEPGIWYMACHLTGHYEQGQVATINVTS